VTEAITQYQAALKIDSGDPQAHNNLGKALLQKGSVDEAITHCRKALEIVPDYAEARVNLGNALIQKGSLDEAIGNYQEALQTMPGTAEVHCRLGNAFLQKGKEGEARVHYQKALEIESDYPEAQNGLAWVLATSSQASLRDGVKAVELAERARRLIGGEHPIVYRTLAAAYAEAGRFEDARVSMEKAIQLAQALGRQDMVAPLRDELKRYEAGLPLHQGRP
jgi:Flp pilus assembly protein TadD